MRKTCCLQVTARPPAACVKGSPCQFSAFGITSANSHINLNSYLGSIIHTLLLSLYVLSVSSSGGFLRTLHFGALPRATGPIGLHNQLRRICLTGSARPVRLQAPATSSIQWRSQSNSSATASADLETTKAPKTKKASKAKKNKKSKKPLTEAQKEKRKEKKQTEKLKAEVAQLKETALTPPKKLPVSFFSLAFAEKYRGIKASQPDPKEAFKVAVAQAKSLDAETEERLKSQARANKGANINAYESWLQAYTPLQIKEANAARRTLSRLVKKDYRPLKDDRLVRQPASAYSYYLKESLTASERQGKPASEIFKDVSKAWNALTQSEKNVRLSINWRV
ncbi:transcriptional regulator family: HMG [Penicillium sp. DV-2018c]|nr:transcriptional regulator family: HMG [Penicillium sp. DV-2018c]